MRRVLLLLMLLGAAAVAAAKVRERSSPAAASPSAHEPPSWPPISPWKPVEADGSMPDGYPIKANDQSKIFHVPSGRFYERTKPDRCYATEADAVADGYRRAKS